MRVGRQRCAWWILVAIIGLAPGWLRADEPSPDVTEPPAAEEFLILPLRVHLFQSDDLPEAHCRLTDADVARIVGKVNRIWHHAGIHWALDQILREPPSRVDRFRLARDLVGPDNLGLFRMLVPEDRGGFAGLHVYYLHRFPVNGVWMGDDFAIVQETAALREVEGGIDEPLPRVTAHELGHALGLSHRQDRTNLLASGTTGTRLNQSEVERARTHARRRKGMKTLAELREALTRAEPDEAARLRAVIDAIPGASKSDKAAR